LNYDEDEAVLSNHDDFNEVKKFVKNVSLTKGAAEDLDTDNTRKELKAFIRWICTSLGLYNSRLEDRSSIIVKTALMIKKYFAKADIVSYGEESVESANVEVFKGHITKSIYNQRYHSTSTSKKRK
jgi:hypothetical protein